MIAIITIHSNPKNYCNQYNTTNHQVTSYLVDSQDSLVPNFLWLAKIL